MQRSLTANGAVSHLFTYPTMCCELTGAGCGETCGNGQKSLTFDNGDYECLDGSERQFCCDEDETWENWLVHSLPPFVLFSEGQVIR